MCVFCVYLLRYACYLCSDPRMIEEMRRAHGAPPHGHGPPPPHYFDQRMFADYSERRDMESYERERRYKYYFGFHLSKINEYDIFLIWKRNNQAHI